MLKLSLIHKFTVTPYHIIVAYNCANKRIIIMNINDSKFTGEGIKYK